MISRDTTPAVVSTAHLSVASRCFVTPSVRTRVVPTPTLDGTLGTVVGLTGQFNHVSAGTASTVPAPLNWRGVAGCAEECHRSQPESSPVRDSLHTPCEAPRGPPRSSPEWSATRGCRYRGHSHAEHTTDERTENISEFD